VTITTTKLTSIAGLAAVAAGLIFILIQCIHPSENAPPSRPSSGQA
jgi:hypothetical protein